MDPATVGLVALAVVIALLARHASRKAAERAMADGVDSADWQWTRDRYVDIMRGVDARYDSLPRRRAA